MLHDLGETLRRTRTASNRSVEEVAMAAVISPSYLRKLERGQVNDPSPRVLRRAAAALDLGYLRLMALAGYLTDADSRDAPAGALEDGLTGEERKALQAFAEFLISRR